METYNYDPSSQAGSEARTAEHDPAAYHHTGSGSDSDLNAAPGFGPAGPVTPAIPGNTGNCVNCGSGQGNLSNFLGNILWAWGSFPSPSPSGVSHVRFYNAAAIQEPLDIYLNGRLVVSDLDYMNFTRYLHIVPGNYLLTVYRRTNPGGAPIINNRVQFQAGNYYLLSILGGPYDYSAQLVIS